MVQFILQIAVSFLKAKEYELKKIESLIKEWNTNNPYDVGIKFLSNLEVALKSNSLQLKY